MESTARAQKQVAPWFWIALLWLGVSLFDATQNVMVMRSEGMHHRWFYLYLTLCLRWIPWALATPLIVHLGKLYPPTKLRPISGWIMHLAAGGAIGLAFAALNAVMEIAWNPWADPSGTAPLSRLVRDHFLNGLLAVVVLYSSVLALSYVLESRQRLMRQEADTARLNEQLSKAQLQVLQQQIQPHFLFNTLNAVSSLVRQNRNEDAVDVIATLGDLLRRVVEGSEKQQVPLQEEIQFLEKYLDIQRVRFSDQLKISVNVPDDLLMARVPSLILQPMVENAFKHGIAKRARGGEIQIEAARSNGSLVLSVYNQGPRLSADWQTQDNGIGIANLRTRLHNLYGKRSEFTLRDEEPEGVRASVSLPFASSTSAEK